MSIPSREQFIAERLISSNPSDEEACPICREPWDTQPNENVGVGCPGNHVFHRESVMGWFDTHTEQGMHNTCPSCRHILFHAVVESYDFDETDEFLEYLVERRSSWVTSAEHAETAQLEEYLDGVSDAVEQCILEYDRSGLPTLLSSSVAYFVISRLARDTATLEQYIELTERHRQVGTQDLDRLPEIDRRFRDRRDSDMSVFPYHPARMQERAVNAIGNVSCVVFNDAGVIVSSQSDIQHNLVQLDDDFLLCKVFLHARRTVMAYPLEGPNICVLASVEEDTESNTVSVTDTRGFKVEVQFSYAD